MNSGCLSPYYCVNLPSMHHVVTESASTSPADARLRIVSERVDLIDNLVISVSVSSCVTYLPLDCFSLLSFLRYVFYGF